jgi:type IV pilus assembly protein PilM
VGGLSPPAAAPGFPAGNFCMARSPYVWGIDIGKCGIKALRCRAAPGDQGQLVAEAFDYVEYPMMLTQPEADAAELLAAGIQEFIGRNDLEGDRVAVSVPGQLGLAKFIKLPPVEAKKIPDIVRYEARQQIPFPLDQVTWDWQRLATGIEESGFVMDAEVAIFAMKREQFAKALAPLDAAGVSVDLVQLTPIALANMLAFDRLPPADSIDHDEPPPSIVLVSIGVDSTDIVVANGLRIWQRSMPVGGSSFTKAIVSEFKLTFAKAEHLKRNAVRAEDPKAVFRAMRPVFESFAAELQRSLNYFTGTDRRAKLGKVLLLGNAAKLRGLSEYVAQKLGLEVERFDKYQRLDGAGVVAAPAFRENRLAFGTAYGLALQAADRAPVATNLLPREIIRDRIVNQKKPWAVGLAAAVLLAAMANFAGLFFAWQTYGDTRFNAAFERADAVQKKSQAATSAFQTARSGLENVVGEQGHLARVHDRRFETLEMLRAVRSLLPRDLPDAAVEDPSDRLEIHVDSLDCEFFPDLSTWFSKVQSKWRDTHIVTADGRRRGRAADREAGDAGAADAATDGEGEAAGADAAGGDAAGGDGAEGDATDGEAAEGGGGAARRRRNRNLLEDPGPSGPGWVIQIAGHHYHNEDRHKPDEDEQFVRSTLVRNLLGDGDDVLITAGPDAGRRVPVAELGIGFPVIVRSSAVQPEWPGGNRLGMAGGGGFGGPDDGAMGGGPGFGGPGFGGPGFGGGRPGGLSGDDEAPLKRFDFILQFCWQPKGLETEATTDQER